MRMIHISAYVLQDRFGRVDIMFSNAGVIGEPDKGVQTTSEVCLANETISTPPWFIDSVDRTS